MSKITPEEIENRGNLVDIVCETLSFSKISPSKILRIETVLGQYSNCISVEAEIVSVLYNNNILFPSKSTLEGLDEPGWRHIVTCINFTNSEWKRAQPQELRRITGYYIRVGDELDLGRKVELVLEAGRRGEGPRNFTLWRLGWMPRSKLMAGTPLSEITLIEAGIYTRSKPNNNQETFNPTETLGENQIYDMRTKEIGMILSYEDGYYTVEYQTKPVLIKRIPVNLVEGKEPKYLIGSSNKVDS